MGRVRCTNILEINKIVFSLTIDKVNDLSYGRKVKNNFQ